MVLKFICTYFKASSVTLLHPCKLRFFRKPPHRFDMCSTTGPCKKDKLQVLFHALNYIHLYISKHLSEIQSFTASVIVIS